LIASHFNSKRKIVHASGVFIPAVLYFDMFAILPKIFIDNTRSIVFYLLLAFTSWLVVLEIIRFRYKWWSRAYMKFLGSILKKEEKNSIPASLPYFFSLTLLTALLPRDIAAISMIFLIIGDPAAAFVGTRYGTLRLFGKKSLEGTIAGITSSTLLAILFLFLLPPVSTDPFRETALPPSLTISIFIVSLAGIASMMAELISCAICLDDNFLIPLTGATVLLLLTLFLTPATPSDIFSPIKNLLLPLPR